MRIICRAGIAVTFCVAAVGLCNAQSATELPEGVTAVWDMAKASHETTPTRERICINGLWRWQPARGDANGPPKDAWGYFKVPGSWPGIGDYLQKDSQTVFVNPAWKETKLSDVKAAWYEREIVVPAEWQGRRLSLSMDYLNSFAVVYVDGKKAGELRFPAGELDMSDLCKAGQKHVLALLVMALPLKGVMLSYADTASAKEVKGTVARRGLCGDVYLIGAPQAARVEDVKVETSVRRGDITFSSTVTGIARDSQYVLRAIISSEGKDPAKFESKPFKAGDLSEGRFAFSAMWKPERLWDIHTPQNVYEVKLSLVDAGGKVVDTSFGARFGFRELWIDGKDFWLNGSRIFLSAVPVDSATIGAAAANYAAAHETLVRLKTIGVNMVYTHNYECEPGSHLGFEELLRAADDVGMLVAMTQPHFSQYDWKAADADANNGYARHAAFYARISQNHPSVVFYAMSHNATGYDQDMNPDLIDGIHDARDQWAIDNMKLALRAEAIVHKIDPTRIVYHHAGGNIGSMHTMNFYPNFAPIQELTDWFGHWAQKGVKPAFMCEYGGPFTWDWTMYRGWYKGQREFGSAAVPWEFCLSEWNAEFLGDRAFAPNELEKANLRWEAKEFEGGKGWHRWDYPTEVGSPRFDDRNTVLGMYITDNWRGFRTLGVSGISAWEYGMFWTLREGVDRKRKELRVDWEKLQRPGLSPDFEDDRVHRMDISYQANDWVPTAAGKALLRNNQPVLAYIGGKSEAVTSKDHNFRAGETVHKQLVIINNARRSIAFRCNWSLGLSPAISGEKELTVQTGQQARIPLNFELPPTLAPGAYEMHATARFGDGEEQADTFVIHVLAPPAPAAKLGKVALFDPKGQTSTWLETLGVVGTRIEADADLTGYDTLIIGKLALSLNAPAPDISRVRDGLKVIVFEQSSEVLEKRLGFRVAEHGLRRVFARIPDHPVLAGIQGDELFDWRGEATTVPPQLVFENRPQHGPTVKWCDIPVSHVWRCGNRGSVTSVLIEKPARGDFRPIVDGGFSLQYSPLMEYRAGKGVVIFCQLDVTGRSEVDPAAERLVTNMLGYLSTWKPQPARQAVYVGGAEGKKYLKTIGVEIANDDAGKVSPENVLVMTPGGKLDAGPAEIAKFLDGGGRVLAIGLQQRDIDSLLPFKLTLNKREYLGGLLAAQSAFAGVGAADLHLRGPRELPLISDSALAFHDPGVVFCQVAPWQFDYARSYNLKRTFRRTSFLLTRLLANMGVSGTTPLLERFGKPLDAAKPEQRWLDGLYLDAPEEWDDPYRFFRW